MEVLIILYSLLLERDSDGEIETKREELLERDSYDNKYKFSVELKNI